jgi:hypothetical protein
MIMEAATSEGRRGGRGDGKKKTAAKNRDVKLTLRMTRDERRRIRLYAVERDLEPNELVLRWYRSRERLEHGPRLAPGMATDPMTTTESGRVA